MSQQPHWVLTARLGDVNPIDYGGEFVYIDKTGVYGPEMDVLDVEHIRVRQWRLYRVVLERCTYVNGVLSDNKYHPETSAWFDPETVARSCGGSTEALIQKLCSDDPVALAEAYIDIGSHYGFENFDQSAQQFTRRSQLPRRILRAR